MKEHEKSGRWAGAFLALLLACFGAQMATAPEARAYAVVGSGWDGAGQNYVKLTYFLAQGTNDLASEKWIIEQALAEWVRYVDLDIHPGTRAGASMQLDFYFTTKDPRTGTDPAYPDNNDTAWVNDILAWGYFPADSATEPFAGNIYFNDNYYNWTGNTYADGTCAGTACDLYFVALHEIGHTLGLAHPIGDFNNLPSGAVMSPYFNPVGLESEAPGFGNFDVLRADDIAGIRSLYAAGIGSIPEPVSLAIFVLGLAGVALINYRRAASSPIRVLRSA